MALIPRIDSPARDGHNLRLAALATAILLSVTACQDPAKPDAGVPEILAEGRPERGLSIVLRVLAAPTDTVPVGAVRWSIQPAGAGVLSGDTLRLLRSGLLQVTADFNGGPATQTIEVTAPPTILFDMVVDGNRDLYRAALDGGDLLRLTTNPAADSDPTVGGGTVVFVSNRDGNDELYSIPLSGGPERRLTATAADELHPALTADGTRLAFARGTGLSRVYVSAPDASGAVRPDPTHGHDGTLENGPAWSPDGKTLVFASTAGGNPDLYRWTSGAASFLEGGTAGDFEPAWSPDGRQIVFSSTRHGNPDLYLLTLASGAVNRLTDRAGSDGFPAWLPDGRIVYVAYEGQTRTLRWLDPVNPTRTHPIPLPGEPGHPAAVR